MQIKSFKARYPQGDFIASNDVFFNTIKSNFKQKRAAGLFAECAGEAVYILCIKTVFGEHWGVVAHNQVSDFKEGKILVHENTLEAKEQKMMEFIMDVQTMVKPVLLAHDRSPAIAKWIEANSKNKPFMIFDFEIKAEKHRVWKVTDVKQTQKIAKLYKDVPRCYLADGHHRSSTMLSIFDNKLVSKRTRKNGVLCAYFHFDQLKIYDYNRIINLGNQLSSVEFVTELSKYCKFKALKKGRKPRLAHQMTLFIAGEWLEVTWRKKVIKKYKGKQPLLDAKLFNDLISTNIMKVKDIREDKRITYFEGTIAPSKIQKSYSHKKSLAIFYLKPILAEDLKYVADRQQVLPPKTTWFEPRIKSGMIVSEI